MDLVYGFGTVRFQDAALREYVANNTFLNGLLRGLVWEFQNMCETKEDVLTMFENLQDALE
jgi:hypothetical protein